MSKNVNHVSHAKSKQIVDGKPKLPKASSLVEGEIAINFAKGVETISTKNESGDVVTFSSDNYYTEQKLGSGFTGENSGKTVTEAIEGMVITVDQVLDESTSSSTNPVSSKAVYKAVTDNELVWTNAFVALSGTVSSHTENTEIHVTSADTAAWNAKVDSSAIANFFDDAKYEDSGTTKVINFYHGSTIKATIDASDFIVDGMVDDVFISGGSLVIDFNTASGKEDISIPLTDIFDPSNYYDKDDIDDLVGSGFSSSSITDVIIENELITSTALTDLDNRKLDVSGFTAHTASTSHMTSTEKTNLDSLSGNIATISGITSTKVSNWDTAYSNNHTHTNKSHLDGISGNVGTMAYENVSSYSSATQVNTALSGKSNTGHTHVSSEITGMSGYTKAGTASAVETGDTLNVAIGKLEKGLDNATANINDLSGQSETIATAIVDLNTKLAEALENANTALANANAALEALSGHTIKALTQAEYDALTVKDPNTVYMITN